MTEKKKPPKKRSKYVTREEMHQAFAHFAEYLFAPPEMRVVHAEDAICQCGHRRDEHCGCGADCAAPANDLERAKMKKGLEYEDLGCKCSGFSEKDLPS